MAASPKPQQRILLVGLDEDHVDYAKWPGLSAEKLRESFERTKQRFDEAGLTAIWCLTSTDDTAVSQLSDALASHDPDIVMIGAGIRVDPDLVLLFERMINCIVNRSPKSRIAFNTSPDDTVTAVQRWRQAQE